ncbi:MAG: hypothetical protein ACRDG7_11355 [Candidatus Limnocylindria bacterium]
MDDQLGHHEPEATAQRRKTGGVDPTAYLARRTRLLLVVGSGLLGLLAAVSIGSAEMPDSVALGIGIALPLLGATIGLRLAEFVPDV